MLLFLVKGGGGDGWIPLVISFGWLGDWLVGELVGEWVSG